MSSRTPRTSQWRRHAGWPIAAEAVIRWHRAHGPPGADRRDHPSVPEWAAYGHSTDRRILGGMALWRVPVVRREPGPGCPTALVEPRAIPVRVSSLKFGGDAFRRLLSRRPCRLDLLPVEAGVARSRLGFIRRLSPEDVAADPVVRPGVPGVDAVHARDRSGLSALPTLGPGQLLRSCHTNMIGGCRACP